MVYQHQAGTIDWWVHVINFWNSHRLYFKYINVTEINKKLKSAITKKATIWYMQTAKILITLCSLIKIFVVCLHVYCLQHIQSQTWSAVQAGLGLSCLQVTLLICGFSFGDSYIIFYVTYWMGCQWHQSRQSWNLNIFLYNTLRLKSIPGQFAYIRLEMNCLISLLITLLLMFKMDYFKKLTF